MNSSPKKVDKEAKIQNQNKVHAEFKELIYLLGITQIILISSYFLIKIAQICLAATNFPQSVKASPQNLPVSDFLTFLLFKFLLLDPKCLSSFPSLLNIRIRLSATIIFPSLETIKDDISLIEIFSDEGGEIFLMIFPS